MWTYRLLVPHKKSPIWKLYSTKSVAVLQDLYLRTFGPGQPDEIEEWFASDFEAPAQEPLQKATSDQSLSKDDWFKIIRFAAAQDVRTPARLMEMLQRWDSTLQPMIEKTLADFIVELTNADVEVRAADSAPEPKDPFPARVLVTPVSGSDDARMSVSAVAGRSLWLFAIRRLLTSTVAALEKHHWTILLAPRGMHWLTSDDPFVKLNWYEDGKYNFKGGWGSEGTDIFMPIGPKHLLYTQVGKRPPERGTVTDENLTRRIQQLSIEHAHRFIFGWEPNDEVERHRPRTESQAKVEAEREEWRRWSATNMEAEERLRR